MSADRPTALLDRVRGSLLGTLVGDALGRPFEGSPRGDGSRLLAAVRRRVAAPRAWGHSDDGEMMLGVADALRERGEVDERHILQVLAENHEPARGYGKGTLAAFRAWASGASPEEAARARFVEGSRGNGAAVRVAPVAAAMVGSEETILVAAARRSALATHAHDEAGAGAALIAVAVHRALVADRREVVLTAVVELARTPFAERMQPSSLACDAADVPEPGVLACESVPAALWAFAGADGFEEAVIRAVTLGGDTDSVGAMTGAIAGAFFGAARIPASFVGALEPDAVAGVERFVDWFVRGVA